MGFGIAVDAVGSAFVVGETFSGDFPTANALQPTSGGSPDAFMAKVNAAGSALVYSTYLGGSQADHGFAVSLDLAGNAYVAGSTASLNFPTMNPLQPTLSGPNDGFVAKLNSAGSALVYSTYLGGSAPDAAYGIGVDGAGNVYAAGITLSSDFPTANALQPTLSGPSDGFVAKLTPAGSALVYSTYLGGSGMEELLGLAVDGLGSAYVTGDTSSTDFPTVNPLQPGFSGGGTFGLGEAFVAKIADQPPPITITIDIKPGTFPNSINPKNKGTIPVAILATDSFDATRVDPTTVLFGAIGTEATPVHSALKDVDRDGDTDMILDFNTQATDIQCGDTSASLTGETLRRAGSFSTWSNGSPTPASCRSALRSTATATGAIWMKDSGRWSRRRLRTWTRNGQIKLAQLS